MDKLSSPFRDGAVRITNTSHNHLGGRTDFTMVRAIDCNREPYDSRVFAEGDGVVIASLNAKNPSSYLHIHYEGMAGNLIKELVHVRPTVAKGAKVKRGQQVGTLEPYRANWYGTGKHHNPHLHWSFLNTNKTGAPNPFNYLDRRTAVTTNEPVIKNSRTWFNANGTFNWSSFGDYKLEIQAPKPPTPPVTCEAEKKQIDALQLQIKALNEKVATREKAIVEKNDTINAQKAQLALKDSDYKKLQKDLDTVEEKAKQDLAKQVAHTDALIKAHLEVVAEKDKEIEKLKAKIEKAKDNGEISLSLVERVIQWFGENFRGGK
jgi:uncharacterized coiled-coil protein SlyX